ncbi:MAG: hypothetical protein AB7T74_10400 [Clostridia bacterium]|jgi:hypothetical protein|nr:hypothetical protein [Spirochaetia bacterium]
MSVDLPGWFPRFMNIGADRSGELMTALTAAGCEPRPVELAGGRFIVVSPRGSVRDRRYRMKVLTAHHDRVPGTPGALDNSAACLQLWRFVTGSQRPGTDPGQQPDPGRTQRPGTGPGSRNSRGTIPGKLPEVFNTVAVFTDHEELSGASVSQQGAYALGKAFSGLGYELPLVLSLDVTGRGDALILSSSCSGLAGMPRMRAAEDRVADDRRIPHLPIHETLAAEVEDLAVYLGRHLAGRMPVYHLPVPFGEDIGFMLAGVPALVCTVLPRNEAEELSGLGGLPQWASPVEPHRRMPATWSALHGPDDTVELYTETAFLMMERFLERVASLKVPARPG